MGFRFRKTIRLGKGVRVNLGKKGASLSLGGKGLTTNLSSKGAKSTLGIPGSGISYTTKPTGCMILLTGFIVSGGLIITFLTKSL